MRLEALVFVVVGVTPVALAGAPAPKTPAEIRVPHTTGAVTIDGRLSEADWQKAPRIVLRKVDGSEATRRTEARMLHDGDRIYIAFQADDPDVWTAHESRDTPMWREDVVEVFVDVDPKDPLYVEIEANPKGSQFDAMLFEHRGKALLSWNPAIEVAVQVDGTVNQRDDKDHSWTVEMSIPAADLAPARNVLEPNPPVGPGIVWWMELCRHDSSHGLDDEIQSWTPVPNDFHATAAYGRVVFD